MDENKLRGFFEQTREYDLNKFKSFYNKLIDLVDLLNAFVAEIRSVHKPEMAYKFMQGAIGIKSVEDLYELMVTDLPLLFDAVGASIFVVHYDPHEGNRLVLQKTSYSGLKSEVKTAYYEIGQGLTGWVWANKRCLRIKNLENQEELNTYQDLEWRGGTHNDSDDHSSFLAVPMFNHTGEVLGVLRLPHKMGHLPFTSDDEIFLRFLADHLSKVIECQAAEDVIEQATGPSGLANAAAEIFAARSPKEIFNAGLNSSIALFEATGKMHFLNLLLPDGLKWKIENDRGMLDFAGKWRGRLFSIHEGLTGKVFRTAINTKANEGDIKYDLKKASKIGEYIDVVPNARSAMAAPILWGKHVYGVVAIASDKRYEFTREKDLRILESLTALIGIALHNYEQRRSKIIKTLLCLGRFLWRRVVRIRYEAIDD
ncbi:MAG: GAF domain-containing protein [Planctomycetota bacterium]